MRMHYSDSIIAIFYMVHFGDEMFPVYYSKTMDLSQFISLREKDLYLSLKKLIAAME